ncbi:MAG: hypothetical protein COW00_07215 [Bdellovibrio sp. CG12_big_fil_rev_8_21_14_0_65_39_13]|nr:MAG: hypothetical protein COW78_17005 [Bdellovibrio sp. CG22_combo_CG10-13_8_21_14_all_39_27]PIQ60276.1 MAG: hypothetical protein COW00_07215 [Bdellovibrio sp. CG12_big_fil_rev_8_21_14_0_65_39_13]PIR34712.1 MAG: hypothetical protein COV37_12320 [Bdellovibrio sp. CG11_big_fil_rev_8_21_14_0_20_39_38]PJB53316.1 MAG: hypothetical protein CO099_07820 [Bdellovibrio sp. CG_4_9_14_3_um_filter_39_7]
MNWIKSLSLFSLLLMSVPSTWAQDSDFTFDPKTKSVIPKFLGKVLLLKGQANALSEKGEQRALKIGEKLYLNDTVQTELSSFLKIEMVDTSLITLGPDSSLKFDEFKYRTKEDRESVYNLIKGQLRTQFRVKAPKEEAIKVKTGMVSMGVRGTEFVVNSKVNSRNERISEVVLLSGKIHLYDKHAKKDFNMKPRDHYISIESAIAGQGRGIQEEMDEETFEQLKGQKLDPRRHFTPLLSFHELSQTASLNSSSSTRSAGRGPASVELDREADDYTPTRSWRSTLNELNKRLNEDD